MYLFQLVDLPQPIFKCINPQVLLFIESLTQELPRGLPCRVTFQSRLVSSQGQECAAHMAVHPSRYSLAERRPCSSSSFPPPLVLSAPWGHPEGTWLTSHRTGADGDHTLPVAADKHQGSNNVSISCSSLGCFTPS